MKCCGIGNDLCQVRRISTILQRHDDEQLAWLFTSNELGQAMREPRPAELLAVCFATKEAVGKALGVGLAGIGWTDVEAHVTERGLTPRLTGAAAVAASERGIDLWSAAVTSWNDLVLVTVTAWSNTAV